MSDVLNRIGDVLLHQDTWAARAWIYQRIDEEMERGEPDGYTHHLRPMFEVLDLTDYGGDSYVYRADEDCDPLATWAHAPDPASDYLTWTPRMTVTFDGLDLSPFVMSMRRMQDQINETMLSFERFTVSWSSSFHIVPTPAPEPPVLLSTAGLYDFAPVDVGRAFTWPPPERPDVWHIDLPSVELPPEHPRTGPPRKATA